MHTIKKTVLTLFLATYAHQAFAATMQNSFLEVDFTSGALIWMGTTGGDPQNPGDNNKRMLYFGVDPDTGDIDYTSWAVFRIEDPDGSNPVHWYYGQPYFFSFPFKGTIVQQPQTSSNGEQITMVYDWEGIEMRSELTLTDEISGRKDQCRFSYTVTNKSQVSKKFGFQIMLDTMIGNNDGAPINIPGVPYSDREQSFTGNNIPPYWYALEGTIANPGMTVQGTLKGYEATTPDLFGIAFWPGANLNPWVWTANPAQTYVTAFGGDSATQLFWTPQLLAPGQTRTFTTYYGLVSISSCQSSLDVSLVAPTFFKDSCRAEEPFTIDVAVSNVSNTTANDVQISISLPNGLQQYPSGSKKIKERIPSIARGATERRYYVLNNDRQAAGVQEIDLAVTATGGVRCLVDRSVNMSVLNPCTPTPNGGSPTVTPTATPTPPGELGLKVTTNKSVFARPDTLVTYVELNNSTSNTYPALMYVVLEFGGRFYFFPSFSENAQLYGEMDFTPGLATGPTEIFRLELTAEFPQFQATWYGAAFDRNTGAILGPLSNAAFSVN